jgi:CBS domain containing-hemolysin-like protein
MDATFQQLLLISIAMLLVFMNGFFVSAEFAIVKVRATRVEELIKNNVKRAEKARLLIDNMDEYLSATQLGITLASLGLGWVGEPAFAHLFEPLFAGMGFLEPVLAHSLAITFAFLLITFLHIVLGELAPKSLAIQLPEPVVLNTAVPMIWFYRLSYPMIWSLNNTALFLLRMLGVRATESAKTAHSEEELRLILAHSQEKGVLGLEERKILERVFDFGDRSVRQIMVPAQEVLFLNTEVSFQENLKLAKMHRHTRYPLCEGSLDKVVGIVHVKDILWRLQELGKEYDLRLVKRPTRFVPESKLIKSLLQEFRQTRTHLSMVVDEFGSTVGIVTMEDILEELVGEIQDEFDSELPRAMIEKTGESQYAAHGRILIEDLESELDISLEDIENDTLAGHIMTVLGRTAEIGDEITLAEKFRVRVVGMKNFQITDLTIRSIKPN